MGKGCCCCSPCCAGTSCCGLCCGQRGATITLSLVGLLLAVAVIVPPVYVHMTDKNYGRLFPVLELSERFLRQLTDARMNEEATSATTTTTPMVTTTMADLAESTFSTADDSLVIGDGHTLQLVQQQEEDDSQQTAREKYKLAIFQLIDDIRAQSKSMALFSFSLGCLNVPVHLLLLAGALCRTPCLMTPWLVVTLLEHLVIGIPLIVFFGIISLYLAAQLGLYLVGVALIGSLVMCFAFSLSTWFTVRSCYDMFYEREDYNYCSSQSLLGDGGQLQQHATSQDPQLTQPLLPAAPSSGSSRGGHRGGGGPGPSLPPGHPNNSYHLGQYPQYYPPHQKGQSGSGARQLPTAPPHGDGGGHMYPQLPSA